MNLTVASDYDNCATFSKKFGRYLTVPPNGLGTPKVPIMVGT